MYGVSASLKSERKSGSEHKAEEGRMKQVDESRRNESLTTPSIPAQITRLTFVIQEKARALNPVGLEVEVWKSR